MTNTVAEQISIFHSKVERRKLDDATLRLLQSILVSKHAKSSLLEIRNSLIEFTRPQATRIILEIVEKTVEEKLFVLEFFVRSFALLGDVESCLALRYEALAMRESVCMNLDWLRVAYDEWLTFAKDSLENGYHSIAVKGCENALSCIQTNNTSDIRSDTYNDDAQVIMKIKELKDVAVALVASHSVQAQAANHWKKKTVQQNRRPASSQSIDPKALASSVFRDGIKKRNMLQLHGIQSSTTEYVTPNQTTS